MNYWKRQNNNGTMAITIKHILTTKTFNHRDLTKNTNSDFRHRNDCNNFEERFENNHGRINNFQDKAPARWFRKYTPGKQETKKHQDVPENTPKNWIVDFLAATHSRTSKIVPEIQQTSKPFLVQVQSHYRLPKERKL